MHKQAKHYTPSNYLYIIKASYTIFTSYGSISSVLHIMYIAFEYNFFNSYFAVFCV